MPSPNYGVGQKNKNMKKNKVIIWALFLFVVLAMTTSAFAREDLPSSAGNGEERRAESVLDDNDESDDSEKGNATSSSAKNRDDDSDDDEDDNATSTEDGDGEGKGRGDEHRSEVAKFVKTLLEIADRTGGIGLQVRIIAQEQASSTEKIAKSLDEVEKRSSFKIFLIGSDYKNLGSIRSELAKTESRLEKLNTELEKVGLSAEEKVEINAEITALEQEQAELEEFIEDNEDKFSLFGWVVRLFQ